MNFLPFQSLDHKNQSAVLRQFRLYGIWKSRKDMVTPTYRQIGLQGYNKSGTVLEVSSSPWNREYLYYDFFWRVVYVITSKKYSLYEKKYIDLLILVFDK